MESPDEDETTSSESNAGGGDSSLGDSGIRTRSRGSEEQGLQINMEKLQLNLQLRRSTACKQSKAVTQKPLS